MSTNRKSKIGNWKRFEVYFNRQRYTIISKLEDTKKGMEKDLVEFNSKVPALATRRQEVKKFIERLAKCHSEFDRHMVDTKIMINEYKVYVPTNMKKSRMKMNAIEEKHEEKVLKKCYAMVKKMRNAINRNSAKFSETATLQIESANLILRAIDELDEHEAELTRLRREMRTAQIRWMINNVLGFCRKIV